MSTGRTRKACSTGSRRARVDAQTVVVTSRPKNRALPGLLLHVVPAHVFSKHADIENDTSALGVGDGAWHVVSKSADSVELGVLGRPGGPPLDQIVFRTVPDRDALIDAPVRGDVDVISGRSRHLLDRLHALERRHGEPHDGDGLQAFRTDNVTGFLPRPEQPSRSCSDRRSRSTRASSRASRPPGEQLSNVTYAAGAGVLLALCAAAYWIATRLRRRFVT